MNNTIKVKYQRPGEKVYRPLQIEGPDWPTVLRNLYHEIVKKIGPGHVFSVLDRYSDCIEIKDIDEFVSGVDHTVENLRLQYVRTEHVAQSGAAMAGVAPLPTAPRSDEHFPPVDKLDHIPLAGSMTGKQPIHLPSDKDDKFADFPDSPDSLLSDSMTGAQMLYTVRVSVTLLCICII